MEREANKPVKKHSEDVLRTKPSGVPSRKGKTTKDQLIMKSLKTWKHRQLRTKSQAKKKGQKTPVKLEII